VNGFLGGEWNDLRKAITVRENRAHSWVEAYLGHEGWVRVDATPAFRRNVRMGTLRQLVDAAELFWGRWIIEYSASQQLLLAQRLGQKFGFSTRSFSTGQHGTNLTKRQALVLAGIAIFAIVIVNQRKRLLRWHKHQQIVTARQRQEQPIAHVYHATIKRLASAGLPRQPWETPHEYVARLKSSQLQGGEILARLTELYASACYGDIAIPPEIVASIRGEASQIGLSS
jgi:hypothetical protein